ncbi:MAG: hypothetical protein DME18_10015, partial [Verrucomicrobia bacterium]
VIPAGETNATAIVASIDDGLIEGDETVTLTVAAGTGYTIGANRTATVRIQDDDQPAVSSDRILFLDDFETDTSFNWRVTFGANNLMDGAPQDYDATFAYDYGADGIPPAPHSSGGTTRGLKLRVNKNDPTPNGSAGVNLYPSGDVAPIFFSSDYALQFEMYLSYGGVSTTEHALCGLNHSGTLTNRVTQSPDPNNSTAGGDGIWAAMVTDASDLIDYGIYAVTNSTSLPTLLVERSASTLAGVFSTPPFGAAGSPANNADASGPRIWVEVELKQVGDTVRLTIDNTQILQVTNPTSFTNGVIMLGMNDQFNSIGSDNNYVIFDNVRVIGLGPAGPAPPNITGAQLAGGNVQIDFAGAGNDVASAFAVESSPEVATGYATETGATVQQTGPGSFRAVLPVNGPIRFYRIRR